MTTPTTLSESVPTPNAAKTPRTCREAAVNAAIDISLVATSCAYAHWLDQSHAVNPDVRWAKVVFGVGYTLAAGTLKEAASGQKLGTLSLFRLFVLSSTPIIIGELAQAWKRRRAYAAFQRSQR